MNTPRDYSPYVLVQEILRDDPWKLLVAAILMNQTSAKKAIPIMENIFKIWPNAESASQAIPELLANVIKPIGLHKRRARSIIMMSSKFVEGFQDPIELPGIGKYGADSYNIFVRGQLVDDVSDKELRRYVEWARKERNVEPERARTSVREGVLSLSEAGAFYKERERQAQVKKQAG